jgi:mono/diheme cytochrome c family protein
MDRRFGQMTRSRWAIAGTFVFAVALGVSGVLFAHEQNDWVAPPEAKNLKNPVPVNDTTVAAGRDVYTAKCVECHGDKGDGNGDEAEMYDPKPGDFTNARMMKEMTDGELFWKITEGKKPMPSFKNRLTEEQRWQVVNYIRTFSKPAAPAPAKPHKDKN